MDLLQKLKELRKSSGESLTKGLPDEVIVDFLNHDKDLSQVISSALQIYQTLSPEEKELLKKPEQDILETVQNGILNFYASDGRSPYLPLAAKGPWIITAYGSVVYDAGGYGMLGFGHNPEEILHSLAIPQVMANVMTPHLAQKRAIDLLKKNIGFTRGKCPYSHFIWLNSGSEGVTAAYRIIDAHSKTMTDPGGVHAGKEIFKASPKMSFHGRTDSAASVSDNSRKNYEKYLASFRNAKNLLTFELNNIASLTALFEKAVKEDLYIEALFMEPVMGEGNPGIGVTKEFYEVARRLTKEHGTILVIDSIQAGLRAHGCLSILDYPGFKGVDSPDIEVFSKAINAGQFPISIVALTSEVAANYKIGLYGNTMTTNPRALCVAESVLTMLTLELTNNIQARGEEFLDKFRKLQREMPDVILKVQGTGLLFGVELESTNYPVLGQGGVEEYLRINGVNVIHSGSTFLRFTPRFWCTSKEVDLVVSSVSKALQYFTKNQMDLPGPVPANR